MKEKTIQVKVTSTDITKIEDAFDLLKWCENEPGLVCIIAAKADGGYAMSVEGRTADRKEFAIGDTVTWDGSQFSVTTP